MRLTLLSNRAPYQQVDGEWRRSIGGLTTALDPVIAQLGGTWLALGEEGQQPVSLPPESGQYTLLPVGIHAKQADLYYNVMANGTLWPLCHGFLERTDFDPIAWNAYEEVNHAFAVAAFQASEPGDVYWVHDYHLALVPEFIRSLLPGAKIGLFWHIPWPSVDMLSTLPWREVFLKGVLGADVIGVHTQRDADKLVRAACELLDAVPSDNGVLFRGREVTVQVNPISVDTAKFTAARHEHTVLRAAQSIKDELGTAILLGVDRLDYSKGIPQRLRAFERFLEVCPEMHGKVSLMQVAAPSREDITQYAEHKAEVEGLVGRINGRYSGGSWVPVRYLYQTLSQQELAALYLAADGMMVTPLRDGLNLVAKEFACTSENGVLILSEFAGAAAELHEALQVNPYDEVAMVTAIHRALNMPLAERVERMQALRAQVIGRDVHVWAHEFLDALRPVPIRVPVHAGGHS